ncbi:NAD(P)-binding protein [Daldinia loculata]|uniref:NAD(P)-binding protein n=1 Tax=Daldinia loculata TaxID=103429 RepID=UPI0020C3A46E|nr:NAD(P)-binding protein [Daldinia loculata]KAI1644599.1 NAD(P)-binding protein [Daldinia loculata]
MSQHLESEATFEGHFIGFLYRQWLIHRKPIPKGTTISGQTAIVTGSNSGLGFEAARQLLQLGLAHLVMGVRSQARGNAAADKLRKEFPDSTISVWLVDMESYDSITAFAKKCETLPRIDIAILNAGLRCDNFTVVEATGHEKTFQVNYLSTILLAILLLPVLKSKKLSSSSLFPPRLSIVTSDTSYWADPLEAGPVLPQFDIPEEFKSMRSYPRSKLLQLYFISKLGEHIKADDVIVNASNPGFCRGTQFGDGAVKSFISALTFWIFQNLNGRTVENGASAVVDGVVTKGKESHGSYVSDWGIRPYPKVVYTKEGQEIRERVWEETLEELNFAGASRIIEEMKR